MNRATRRPPGLLGTTTVLAIALVGVLAACGGKDGGARAGDEDVASLVTQSPSASASADPVPKEPPLIRPDTSQAERDRLWSMWQRCIDEHGLTKARANDADLKRREQLCGHLQPEELWQRAQRTDPEYADKLRAWVTCIRSHGIDAWENDGFLAFKSLPPDSQLRHVNECQAKAFGSA